MCPRCGKPAPIVYRGVAAYCSACGAPRLPLADKSVTLAGQPAKIGGTVARVAGWVALAIGWPTALLLGLLFQWIFPASIAGLVVGLPIALATAIVALMLMRGGRALQTSGESAERTAQIQAVFALASHRGGMLTALDVAAALDLSPASADLLLTELAKTMSERVSLELDERGGLYYRFNEFASWAQPGEVRVGAPDGTSLDAEPFEAESREPMRGKSRS